ncbi:MAG: SDR family oxidoreductase [Calditrichaeota bacterium]|nr:MAG: SDR family NAD(P)-dependent oxidoreductase [Calditrichota bacterium]MBL1207676.1 SDR family oxidoreductase [Calditrichota bacterium]NOG47509.1 SDR family oxidoreductase [Calditrichota bacterium]
MKKVLVAGATGYLGRYLIQELKKQGYWVRALARNSKKLEDIKDLIDEVFEGEVTKPETLNKICDGIDAVISAVGITRQKDGLTYMDVDYQGNKNLLDLTVQNKVSKFIFISVLNAQKMGHLKGIEAKLLFEEKLIESGLDYAVIRPTGFFSDMLEFLNMAKKGRVSVFGSGENKINPIHGADLAEVCVNSLKQNEKEINVGGPQIFTFNEIAELALKIQNKPIKISRLPMWMIKIILPLMRTFTSSKTYGPLEFMMTVMIMDVVGDIYGSQKLKEFYKEKR